jgi:hypothetical protein
MLRLHYTYNPSIQQHELFFDLDEMNLHVQIDFYFFVIDSSFEPADESLEKGLKVLYKMLEGWLHTIEQMEEGKKRYLLVEVWDENVGLIQIESTGTELQCSYVLHWAWSAGAHPATFDDREYVDESKVFLCHLPAVRLNTAWFRTEIVREMNKLERANYYIENLLRSPEEPLLPIPVWHESELRTTQPFELNLNAEHRNFCIVLVDVLVFYTLPIPKFYMRSSRLEPYQALANSYGKNLLDFLNDWFEEWRKRIAGMYSQQSLFVPIEWGDQYFGGLRITQETDGTMTVSYGFINNPDGKSYTYFELDLLDDVVLSFSTTKERILQSLVLEVQ